MFKLIFDDAEQICGVGLPQTFILAKFNRDALEMAQILERLMTKAPKVGLSVQPKRGVIIPVVSVIPKKKKKNAQKSFSLALERGARLKRIARHTSERLLLVRTT